MENFNYHTIYMHYLRNLSVTSLLLLLSLSTYAQVSTGSTTPHASAQLDIVSDNKGLLIPRVGLTSDVTSPATGLLVYQTDGTAGFYYYNGTSWERLSAATKSTGEAIIPFASGLPITLKTILGGFLNERALVGSGSCVSGVTQPGGNINLSKTTDPNVPLNQAFSVPRNGVITSMSASFSTTSAVDFPISTVEISAQLYYSNTPNNTFSPLPGAVVALAPRLSTSPFGTIVSGEATGLSISVTARTRLLLVFSADVRESFDAITTIIGYASASVAIE
jgi:BclB C-terminal domain-containing protein